MKELPETILRKHIASKKITNELWDMIIEAMEEYAHQVESLSKEAIVEVLKKYFGKNLVEYIIDEIASELFTSKVKQDESLLKESGENLNRDNPNANFMQTRELTDEEWLAMPKEEILHVYKKMLMAYIKNTPNQQDKAIIDESKIEEFWDEYSENIGSNIEDLDYYSGKTVMIKDSFFTLLRRIASLQIPDKTLLTITNDNKISNEIPDLTDAGNYQKHLIAEAKKKGFNM